MKRNFLQVLRTPQWRETVATLAALSLILQSALAQAPQWWTDQGVFEPGAIADDYAVANVGQLKNMVQRAGQEMNLRLVNGAGGAVHHLIESWSFPGGAPDDFSALTAGQLKAAARPFLDRMGLPYPWPAVGQTDDYAVVNVGQLKNAFSFAVLQQTTPAWSAVIPAAQLAADRAIWDGLVAAGTAAIGSTEWDFDGDGISNLQEFLMGEPLIDPNDIDGDGISNADEDLYPDILNKRLFADAVNDPDADGALNFEEVLELHSDPTLPFSQHVGGTIPDGQIMAWKAASEHDPVLVSDETGFELRASDFGFTDEADQDGNGLPDGLDALLAYEEPEDGSGYGIDTHYAAMPPIGSSDLDRDAMPNLWEYRFQLDLRSNDAGSASGWVTVPPEPDPNDPKYWWDINQTGTDEFDEQWYDEDVAAHSDAQANQGRVDPDRDELANLREYWLGTNPKLADSDGDGLSDGRELQGGGNPLDVLSILPVQLSIVSGNAQSSVGGQMFGSPFVVQVSRGGRPWPGETVTFASTGATVGFGQLPEGPWEPALDSVSDQNGLISLWVMPSTVGSGWVTLQAVHSDGAAVSGTAYFTPAVPLGVGSPAGVPGTRRNGGIGGIGGIGTGESQREVFGAIRVKRFTFAGSETLSDEEDPDRKVQIGESYTVTKYYRDVDYGSSDAPARADDGIDADFDLEDNPLDYGDPRDEHVGDDNPDDGRDEDGDGDPDDPDEPTSYAESANQGDEGAYEVEETSYDTISDPYEPEVEPEAEEGEREITAHNGMRMNPPYKNRSNGYEFSPSMGEDGLESITWHRPGEDADFHGWMAGALVKVGTEASWTESTTTMTGKWEGGNYSVDLRSQSAQGEGVQFRLQTNLPVAEGQSIERIVLIFEATTIGDEEPTYESKGSVTLRIPEGQVVATEVAATSGQGANYVVDIGNFKAVELTAIPDTIGVTKDLFLLPVELAVDADRDGLVTFGSDSTSSDKPFRFWVNDDHDHGVDTEDLTGDPNWDDGMINGSRDLEDFTVLRIRVGALRQMLSEQNGKIGFRWKDTSGGSPSCRIFTGSPTLVKAADYLSTPDGAETVRAQNNLFGRNTLVSGGSAAWLRSSLLTETSSDEITLLMEGCADGKGKLTLVFELNGQTVDGPSLDVQLLRVGEMYDRGRITVDAPGIPNPWDNVNPPALTWAPDTAAGSPKVDPNAKAKTIIWVHGWRMDYAEYASWGDTSFKRLWQMGFKGRFYAFRWPTFSGENDGLPSLENITPLDLWRDGGLTYNASEYRSWLSGPALANFVNQTANSGSRYLFAHSMGNVISGAALRSGMNVTKYAMCNAAMASMAYDGVHNDQPDNDFETIDTDPIPLARAFWGMANRFNPTGRTTMANFALPMDDALGLWSFNNEWFKPYNFVLWGYGYDRWNPDPNEKLWYGNLGGVSFVRYLTTDAEAFGYCVQARTRAAGAKLGVGNMDATVDMSTFGFGNEHSAEWNRSYQNSYGFWKRLMEEFDEDVSNR